MAGLQVLEDTFSAQGLHVLGFFSDDFGNQGGSKGDIDACNAQFGVTFQQFASDHVIGASAQPVFAWLAAQPNPGPSLSPTPTWNFHKYLVARDGTLVGNWDTPVYPGDDPADPNDSFASSASVIAIEAELAKP